MNSNIKLSRLDKTSELEPFTCQVEVEDPYNYGGNARVSIQYRLDFEYRNWGIKSLYITIPPQTIEYTIKDEDGNWQEKTLNISDDNTEIQFTAGSEFLFPYELEIGPKGNMLYFSSNVIQRES